MSYASSGIDESLQAAHEALATYRHTEKVLCAEIEHVRAQRNERQAEVERHERFWRELLNNSLIGDDAKWYARKALRELCKSL